MGMITSVIVLSLLIFFHELGHFLAARFFGVHVEVFSIGFGKKVISKTIGATEYCLSLIPLGGYVQMKGQDDSDPTKVSYDADSYTVKRPWQKIVILFAGPFANFLLAFVLFFAIGTLGITKFTPTIGKISENSPAFNAGLQEKDTILMINKQPIRMWDDVSSYIQSAEGLIELTIEREGQTRIVIVEPKLNTYKNMFGETMTKKMVGILPLGTTTIITYSLAELPLFAWQETEKSTMMIITGLQKLVEGVVSPKELGGIISIVQITSEASQMGLVALFSLTALISVNLGVLNLLPIPALDGGHIMFNLYEMITKRPPSEKVLSTLTMMGWVLLLGLMVLSLFNDIYRLTNGN